MNKKQIKVQPKNKVQKQFMNAVADKPVVLATGIAGSGKAQPVDALIKVPNGWITMKDIKIGDVVQTPKNKKAKVTNKYFHSNKDIYKLTLQDGRQVLACDEHLWKVIYDTKEKIVTTKQLLKDMTLSSRNRFYLPLTEPIEEEDKDFLIHPYLLGVLLGDGCLLPNKTMISTADNEILTNIVDVLDENYEIRHNSNYDYCLSKKKKNPSIKNIYTEELNRLGLVNKKSYQKFIPNDYMFGSIYQRIELLQGLFDTDGSISENSIEFTSTSEALIKQVAELIYSLGGTSKITSRIPSYTYNGEKRSGRVAYRLHVSRIPYEIKKELFKLTRKKNKISKGQYDEVRKIRIESIEYEDTEPCYCIEIDDKDHLYLTNGYVVTHNTYLSAALALEHLSYGFVDKIINVRPIVATEDIGYLPGGIPEKLDPYLQPLMDAYEAIYDTKTISELCRSNQIQIATLAHMRGRNLANAFIILDEAQNTTIKQMYMFLTRFGENVKVVITGDPNPAQTDIRGENGLVWAMRKLQYSPNVAIIKYSHKDVVRSELVKDLLHHLEKSEPSDNEIIKHLSHSTEYS